MPYRFCVVEALSPTYSLEEYAEVEAQSEMRFELCNSIVVAMAGGTFEHADLISVLLTSIKAQLEGAPYRVTSSDLRVGHDPTEFRAYPDIVVSGRRRETSPRPPKHTLVNPIVVVEVTSNGTAAYDRGEKLAAYQRFESLEVIVIVCHRERWIQVHEKTAEGWSARDWRNGQVANLWSGRIRLGVDQVYEAASAET